MNKPNQLSPRRPTRPRRGKKFKTIGPTNLVVRVMTQPPSMQEVLKFSTNSKISRKTQKNRKKILRKNFGEKGDKNRSGETAEELGGGDEFQKLSKMYKRKLKRSTCFDPRTAKFGSSKQNKGSKTTEFGTGYAQFDGFLALPQLGRKKSKSMRNLYKTPKKPNFGCKMGEGSFRHQAREQEFDKDSYLDSETESEGSESIIDILLDESAMIDVMTAK